MSEMTIAVVGSKVANAASWSTPELAICATISRNSLCHAPHSSSQRLHSDSGSRAATVLQSSELQTLKARGVSQCAFPLRLNFKFTHRGSCTVCLHKKSRQASWIT